MPTLPIIILLILTCGAADRIIGWGKWGRTKPVIATALALGGFAYAIHLPIAGIVTFPLAFMTWRTPAWGLLGGSINPAPSQALGTFLRHLLTLAFLVPAYFARTMLATGLCMVAFAAVATGLAVYNYFNRAHSNQFVETARGLALGALLAVSFIVLRK